MSTVLITGADGHIGRAVAADLIARTGDDLVLMCRAAGEVAQEQKLSALGHVARNSRCQVVFADLEDRAPFSDVGCDGISHVIHCGAATDFGIERELAKRVNIDGTQKAVDFARSCPNLERFVFLSSLYAAGLRDGEIGEVFFDDSAEFANHYEWSKWQAEEVVRTAEGLPWQVVRVGTILCDDDSGRVTQFNVIHNTLKLLYYGLLSVVPGNAETRVYLTTTCDAVESITHAIYAGKSQRILHVTGSGKRTLTLGELLDRVHEAFMRDEKFSKHGVLKPLFCDWASFELLAESIDRFGGAMSQSLQSIYPFAPQLYSDKDVKVGAGDAGTDFAKLIDATCEFLTATRWGKDTEEGRLCA